jgi:hypothetical protein
LVFLWPLGIFHFHLVPYVNDLAFIVSDVQFANSLLKSCHTC